MYSETPNSGPDNSGPFQIRTYKVTEVWGKCWNFDGQITGVPEFDAIGIFRPRWIVAVFCPERFGSCFKFSTSYKKSGAVGPRIVMQYSSCKRLVAAKHYLVKLKHSPAILLIVIRYIWDTDITTLCEKLLKRHVDFSCTDSNHGRKTWV